MNTETDKLAYIKAHRAYEEHMLLAIGLESADVEEYLKIKEAALNKAGEEIRKYGLEIANYTLNG